MRGRPRIAPGGLLYVGAVHRNGDGSLDRGLVQANDVHAGDADLERMRRDAVYAVRWAYEHYQVFGADPWACSPEKEG